jgi:hypothetical protein
VIRRSFRGNIIDRCRTASSVAAAFERPERPASISSRLQVLRFGIMVRFHHHRAFASA